MENCHLFFMEIIINYLLGHCQRFWMYGHFERFMHEYKFQCIFTKIRSVAACTFWVFLHGNSEWFFRTFILLLRGHFGQPLWPAPKRHSNCERAVWQNWAPSSVRLRYRGKPPTGIMINGASLEVVNMWRISTGLTRPPDANADEECK